MDTNTKHTCKLCSRRFSSGRALGGHMRSHIASAAGSASTSSSCSQEIAYGLREYRKKSFRLADPDFGTGAGSSIVLQDPESEAEAESASVHRRRSKRRCLLLPELPEPPEPASSVSDATPEEDVALSLMMLSRDSWSRSDGEEDDGGGGNKAPVAVIAVRLSRRSRFQCGTCKKVFRSYQALGGHRASHKKSGAGECCASKQQICEAESSEANAEKLHECPICFRVFSSGQALGGHKRSHLVAPAAATPSSSLPATPPAAMKNLIDLNLPAPVDDDVELSAVSDAEFVPPPAGDLKNQRINS